MNDIDFLRRNGEWSKRWVVGDIEATIDWTVTAFSQVPKGQQMLILRVGVLRCDQKLPGRDLVVAVFRPR